MRYPIHLLLLLLLLCSTTAIHAEMYRWTDEQGKTHYSDKIPPQHQHRGHSQLNQQGVIIDRVSSSLTPAQRLLRTQQKKLQRRQQSFQQQRHSEDQTLLQRYDSADDLIMTRNGKIARIDHATRILEGRIEEQRKMLFNQQQRIDAIQAQKEPVPVGMIEKLLELRRQVKQEEAKIAQAEVGKQQLQKQYRQELQRYQHLKQPDKYPAPTLEQQSAPIEGVITCSSGKVCDSLWKRAVAYVKKQADTPVKLQTDELVITEDVMQEEQISLILSLIGDSNGATSSIFLEVRCRASARREPCSSERAVSVSRGFRPALLNQEAP